MPLDAARWQIEIAAADRTAQAFGSVERRMRQLERTQQQLGQTMSAGGKVGVAALNMIGTAAVRLLPPIAAGALAWKAFSTGLKAGDLLDAADALNLTTDELQAFRLVAAQGGVEAQQLDKAIATLAGQMSAAKDGNDDAIERFDRLGVKLLDVRGQLRPMGQLLPEVAAGLARMGNEQDRLNMGADLFGSRGGRMVNVLAQFASGTAAVEGRARAVNAVIEKESIEAWNKLDAQLKVTQAAGEAVITTLGAPIATWALEQIQRLMASIADDMARVKREAATAPARALQNDVAQLEDQLAAAQQRQKQHREGSTGWKLEQGSVEGLEKRLREARRQAELTRQAGMQLDEDEARRQKLPGVSGGAGQPTGKKASAAGEKLDERLRELQDERKALDRALQAFDVKGNERVEDIDRKLNAQVALDKKIFDVLKNVPPNSPLAQQLTQEAVAISQLNQRLDERKRLLGDAERITAQFGNGSRLAAYEINRLNEMYRAGAIDAATYARALKDINDRAADQERAARGALGGWQGYMAGVEQAMADQAKANTAFELGRRSVDMLSESLDILAGRSKKTFGELAADFAMMIAQWELQAAASNVWNWIRGKGPTNQGIGGSIGDWLGGLFGGGGGGGGPLAVDGIPTIALAGGGDYPANGMRLTGEDGPELDIPRRPGTILNRDQVAQLGGATVHLHMTNMIGSVVSHAELQDQLRAVEERARTGAIAGVLEAKSRGGSYRAGLRR